MNAAKVHVSSILKADFEKLAETYDAKVTLMPGHEFLKKEYGLSEAADRSQKIDVESEKLLAVMAKKSAERPERPVDRIDAMLETLKYDVLPNAAGDFATDASDPVGTADGKLHFSIEEGDVVLKVSPPKGDFLLLQLRNVEGSWRVVAEYLD